MRTLIDALRENAKHTEKGIIFVRSDGREQRLSYAEVWREARRRAHLLSELGVRRSDRVLLTLPEPDDFVLSFFGAMACGAVPVPLYPPQTLARLDTYFANLARVAEVSGAKLILTSRPLPLDDHAPNGASNGADHAPLRSLGKLRVVKTDEIAASSHVPEDAPVSVTPDDLAFLQFTSGSTSHPKGVMVTHANLEANSRAIMFQGLESDPDVDRGVSWLPLYHDMGLIGFVIAPIFAEVPVVLLPTTSFIRRPSSWLDAVHRYRGTITFAPNFAYALAVQSIAPRQIEGWDLSCLRALGCGAEPIDPATVRAFLDKFESAGLRRTVILPSYGLAESTLAVTFSDLREPMVTDRVDPHALRNGMAVPALNGHSMEIVSCGRPFDGHSVEIVDSDGAPLPERRIGEIVVAGPSVAKGYFSDEHGTGGAFKQGRLFTGDLGYFADGSLFVCGRTKDVIILRGRNYFPQDIEKIISAVQGIRASQVAVFTCSAAVNHADAPANGELSHAEQRLVAVAEVNKAQVDETDALRRAIVAAVHEQMGLRIDEVHLLRRGALPKTSSGKVRRRETRARLQAGTLAMATGSEE
jgi:fatty-acyl-CoA synthase